jgi:hypothetical protein
MQRSRAFVASWSQTSRVRVESARRTPVELAFLPTLAELTIRGMNIATVIWVVDPDREDDFPTLLDKLRPALEERFRGHAVQIGDKMSPAPVPIIVHDVGDENVKLATQEELDKLDPEWGSWVRVAR